MAEIRRLQHPDEWKAATALSDLTFRDAEHISMGKAFPGAFSAQLQQSFGAFEHGKLVSFMGLVPSVVRVGGSRLYAYSLGSVCTAEEHRGRGYASAILQDILAHIRQAGASLLLVSGGRSLYTRVGCAPFGTVTRFKLSPSASPASAELPDGAIIREMGEADWFGLYELAAARSNRYEQSIWDLANLIDAAAYASCMKQHHKVLVAEHDGRLQGFAVIGVPYPGKPPVGRAYEWAGAAKWVQALLTHAVRAYSLQELTACVPWHEQELAAQLTGVPSEHARNDGTILVVSPERLAEQLASYVQAASGTAERLTMEQKEGGVIRIGWKQRFADLSMAELIQVLFDTDALQEASLPLDGTLREELSAFLPLPFPYDAGINYV